jgi:hypothetical protein
MERGSVKVAVSDGGGPGRPCHVRPPVSSLGGRGLGIVECLSKNWGVEADNVGQTVWAVLPAPRPGGAGDTSGAGDLAGHRPA